MNKLYLVKELKVFSYITNNSYLFMSNEEDILYTAKELHKFLERFDKLELQVLTFIAYCYERLPNGTYKNICVVNQLP